MVVRFILSGFFNTGTTYLVYVGLLQWLGYKAAYTIAFALGILIAYGLNAIYVFRVRLSRNTFIKFPVLYIFQYVLGLSLVALMVEIAGVAAWIAPLIAIAVTVPLTFALAKSIFASKKNDSEVGCAR